MEKESIEFRKGYAEAAAVFEVAYHPGYCRDHEQSSRIARAMLKAGLTGQEAQRQRSDFIAADRQRNQGSGVTIHGSGANGSGEFIKPSSHSESETLEDIFARRKRESTATPTNTTGGTIQKIHFDEREAE